LKSGSLILLEPSGPVQACNGIALPFFKVTMKEQKKKGKLERKKERKKDEVREYS